MGGRSFGIIKIVKSPNQENLVQSGDYYRRGELKNLN